MKLDKSFILKRILPVVLGLIGGYAYYYFIGCMGGNCPLTSNPYISTLYGGVLGLIFALPSKKKEEQKNEQ